MIGTLWNDFNTLQSNSGKEDVLMRCGASVETNDNDETETHEQTSPLFAAKEPNCVPKSVMLTLTANPQHREKTDEVV